jgi:hypothetical protein
VGVNRAVRGPDGRDWLVRASTSRVARPVVRIESKEFSPLAVIPGLVAGGAILFAAAVRGAVGGIPSLLFRVRYVEARHDGPPFSRMTWVVPVDRVEAVVDQVARQLELGYDRIQPHNAQFLGFG